MKDWKLKYGWFKVLFFVPILYIHTTALTEENHRMNSTMNNSFFLSLYNNAQYTSKYKKIKGRTSKIWGITTYFTCLAP